MLRRAITLARCTPAGVLPVQWGLLIFRCFVNLNCTQEKIGKIITTTTAVRSFADLSRGQIYENRLSIQGQRMPLRDIQRKNSN